MKAMIFAAGLGTRLRPLTDTMPKALVTVGGVPMLERIILNMKHAGFDQIIVNVHHFPDMIINFLESRQNFGIKIAISDEREKLLDTGGGIAKASKWLEGNEPILIHNADILTDLDLNSIYEEHITQSNSATLWVSHRPTSRYLLFDDTMRMKGWTNIKTGEIKPSGTSAKDLCYLAFNGIHVISAQLLPLIREYGNNTPFSITDFYIDSCSTKSIAGYIADHETSWLDIGKPDALKAANLMALKNGHAQ